jgi:uroporphyrinogen-III synthase
MRLLVTRPEPEASRTAKILERLGHEPIVSPLFRLRLLDAPLPMRRFQAVLVTSTNAVRALAEHPERQLVKSIPLLAVGDQTAVAAKRAGFAEARSAGGAVADLADFARKVCNPESGPLLYAAGAVRTGDLEGRLRQTGFKVEVHVLYDMEPTSGLTEEAVQALSEHRLDGVLVYSRRAASALTLALRGAGLAPLSRDISCFCLSRAAAEPLDSVAAGPVVVAERPDQLNLMAAVEAAARPGPSSR